ncbi:formate dehydrogenase major subunit/NADH-quinone oxidoreductase subunit G, partial [Dethiosulfatibacter aminovorans DSM 17477]
ELELIYTVAKLTDKLEKPYRGIITLKDSVNTQGALDAGFDVDAEEIIEAVKAGQIKGLLIVGEDVDGLDVKPEYLAVMDIFDTVNTEAADLVIPMASLAESCGTITRTDNTTGTVNPAIASKTGMDNVEVLDGVLGFL